MRKFGMGILAEDIMERTWIRDHRWEETKCLYSTMGDKRIIIKCMSAVWSNQDVMAVQTEAANPQRQRKQSSSAEAAIPVAKSFDEIVQDLKRMQPTDTLFDIFYTSWIGSRYR
jgi:hypothetical protein